MRDLGEVLDRMIEALDEPNSMLHSQLSSIRDSVSYQPPETMRMWWHEVAMTLEDEFGDPADLDGKHKMVADIFMGRA